MFNDYKITQPTKHRLPKSVFLSIGWLLILIILAISGFSIQELFYSLIALCVLIVFFWIRREIKNSFDSLQIRNLFESSPFPIQVLDQNGVALYVNPSFTNWSKLDLSSTVGLHISSLVKTINKNSDERNPWVIAKSELESGKAWIGDVEFLRQDGLPVVSTITITPISDVHRKLFRFIVQYDDLTERIEFTRKIDESEKRYRSIVETSPDGIVIIQGGQLQYVNPSAIILFGYSSADEMKSLSFMDTIANPAKQSLSINPEGQAIGEELLRDHEMRGLTKQRKTIDLEVNAHVVSWNNRSAVRASFRDITERKMLERDQALWLWEQEILSEIDRKLVGILEIGEIFSAILQQTLNLTRAHFGGVLLISDSTDEARWMAIRGNSFQHSLESFNITDGLSAILRNEEPIVINDSKTEEHYHLLSIPVVGEEKLASTIWMPLKIEGKKQGVLVIGYKQFHNFSGREMRLLISLAEKHSIAMVNAQLYANLLQREKELEVLSEARVQAQEEERRRIAREIHDSLGQMLTAIKFNLEILEDMIKIGPDERERIDEMKNLLDSVIKEAREISYNLMPSVLEDFGLAPALQLLSEQFSNHTSVKVQFHAHDVTERLDPKQEIGLYRIAQESLNNIAKHAEATEVGLQIIRHANGVRLTIEDNGRGFVVKQKIENAFTKNGLGLVSMRERAASFGGIFTIDSTPYNGTLITVEIPILKAEPHE